MSTCNCGMNKQTIPTPAEGHKYAPLSTAYDTLSGVAGRKKICPMEYFLILLIIIIIYMLSKDQKWI